jgi:hypothetical protein
MKPLPIFFVGVKPWLHLGMRIWAPFLEPENINNVNLGVIWNFGRATGLP